MDYRAFRKRRASKEMCKEHPCTDIELIEESFEFKSMVMCCSLCIDVSLMNVCFLSCICFYILCMWFHGWIEVREEEWMSFNCLSKWARRFLQGVQLNCPQGVRDCRVQLEKAFVLIFSKVQIGTVPCKECTGQEKTQSCNSEQSIEGLLLQECTGSNNFNT